MDMSEVCVDKVMFHYAGSLADIRHVGMVSKALAETFAKRTRRVRCSTALDASDLLKAARWFKRCRRLVLMHGQLPPKPLDAEVEPEVRRMRITNHIIYTIVLCL